MKSLRLFFLITIFLVVAALLTLQGPLTAKSSSLDGILPTPEPTEPPVPGIVVRVPVEPDIYFPATGASAISPLAEGIPLASVQSWMTRLWEELAGRQQTRPLNALALPSQDTSPITRLAIPALKVDSAVRAAPFNGTTWEINSFGYDIAWLEQTAHPGQGGNTILAGHLNIKGKGNGPFRYLLYLRPGAEITVYTQRFAYVYRVSYQSMVSPDNFEAIKSSKHPQLILVTCSQWDKEIQSFRSRRLVYAELIKVIHLRNEE